MKTIPAGSKVPVLFTTTERDLIREHTFYNPDFAKVATLKGKKIEIMLTLEEIEEIQEYVAAEANHASDKAIEAKLDKLYDRLQDILDRHIEE